MDQHVTNLQKTNKMAYLGRIHLAKKCLVKNEDMLRNSRFIPINVNINYYMLVGQNFIMLLQSLLLTSRLIISAIIGYAEARGSFVFIIFNFQQFLLLEKIDLTHGYIDSKASKS
jgi:hypothetical protein